MPDPLAAFDGALLEDIAREEGVDVAMITDLLRRQQRLVRDFPDMTVEALVHDWRTAFPQDPLVETDDVAYYLSVREHVWRDLTTRMDLSDPEISTLRAANARQFHAVVSNETDDVPIVLTK